MVTHHQYTQHSTVLVVAIGNCYLRANLIANNDRLSTSYLSNYLWIQGMSLSEHSLNTGVIRKVSLCTRNALSSSVHSPSFGDTTS